METPSASSSRPYRSKIKRPCDRCRRRKTSCILPDNGPCQGCAHAEETCAFELPPTKRRRGREVATERDESSLDATPSKERGDSASPVDEARDDEGVATAQENPEPGLRLPSSPLRYSLGPTDALLQTQAVQHVCSLEQMDGSTALMCGISAELDPWLLRHCKYDDFGMCRLHGTLIRNVGGVPVRGLVPVHFSLVDDYALEPAQRVADNHHARNQLNHLVPPMHGQRLYALALEFVFPLVPVLSRSREALQSRDASMPPMLLAAIYASAVPFAAHDAILFTSGLYDDALCERLWDLVGEEVRLAAHAPKLAVMQASVLLLQRLPPRHQRGMGDTPARMALHGSTIALATSLGLHLEPRPWGVPAWEKRLRRRLWWALLMEDKWTSLLLGRPAMIRESEWDVSDLDDADFDVDDAVAHIYPAGQRAPVVVFTHFTRLTRLAEAIHQTFYTLRASQKLCEDFRASIDAARPIRDGLRAWYAGLPETLRLRERLEGRQPPEYHTGAAALHLSYLTLELYLYRAILRPLARSSPPPTILPENGSAWLPGTADAQTPSMSSWMLDDLTMETMELDQLPGVDFAELGDAAEATLIAAEKCAGIIVKFVGNLSARDFDAHWYPWTRICFATVTSFIALLLVQAPTGRHALRSKELLERWSSCLRTQHKSHEGLMTLGLLRLHSLREGGLLGRAFVLSPAAACVLRADAG